MTTPPEQLEQALERHGDMLYRIALLAAGDERGAGLLLGAVMADIGSPGQSGSQAAPPPGLALDEPALLAHLVAVARREEERAAAQRPRARPQANLFAPFALHHLPLDQRLALGLHLLPGYDGPRLARALGCDLAPARAALVAAVRALGPTAGYALADRVSGELCDPVREALVDPVAGARASAAVRGHLAVCALCRAFDHAWAGIIQSVEATLRAALREHTLTPALRARLLDQARPARGLRPAGLRLTRVVIAPLAVLAVIAALVLPGFLRRPASVVDHSQSAPVDPQALIARALERHKAPPDRSGVWYGRYETLWFFNDDLYAPMRAEIWLDPQNPARHRLQLTHRDGGAPYELQIGDGRSRLFYALDAAYAPALYGALPTATRVEQPALIDQDLDAAGQVLARDERLQSGPWLIPPVYLRQAQLAADLRLLGRQREGGRVVQILSFSGVSPLGRPPDAPGATAERVTVLLALDSEDGLLRSATELAGPPGTTQTGRVTWRLVDEQWLMSPDQIGDAFAAEQAWTGVGDFAEVRRLRSADLALPVLGVRAVGDPARLLTWGPEPLWAPAGVPPGVERALLLWSESQAQGGRPPEGLIYLGQGRRLVLAYNRSQELEGERLAVGPWRVTLRPGRGQRYTALLVRPGRAGRAGGGGSPDPSATIVVDAFGFTRAEVLAVVEAMRPFDRASLGTQDDLFVRPEASGPQAREAALAGALGAVTAYNGGGGQPPAGCCSSLSPGAPARET